MDVDRVVAVLRAVLPESVDVTAAAQDGRSVVLRIGSTHVRARWLARGWPRQVRATLDADSSVDVLAAPTMSDGARAAAEAAGVGWIDETGAAGFAVGPVVVATSPRPSRERPRPSRSWTPATLGVVEALLTGTPATVAAVAQRTGLAEGTATNALAFLTNAGLLTADAARGPHSGRRVDDPAELLEAYAEAAATTRSTAVLRVGLLARDPVADVAAAGRRWEAAGRIWAATGALAAAVQAPYLTDVAPLEVYVAGRSSSDLRVAARTADLPEIEGGRLLLRLFPGPVTARLSGHEAQELRCVPWPRTYADLRVTGVRGEEAAEHLRDQRTHQVTA